MGIGARHHGFAGFQRLAQTVQHRAGKFRQLIQKQHAQMRQRYLARFDAHAAADHRGHGWRNDADRETGAGG